MKVFVYSRVSGRSQATADRDGLPRQKAACEAWAKSNKATIVEHFEEKGVCGEGEWQDRPAFSEMIGRILDNGVRVIVVENLGRLARKYIVQEHILIWLASKGIELYAAESGENITQSVQQDPSKKLLVQMQGVIYEYEKSALVKKLKAARQRCKATNKSWKEGRKPFGFRPGEPEIIERILQLARKRAPRLTNAAIAAALDAEGLPTRYGRPWAAETVRRILKRERRKK